MWMLEMENNVLKWKWRVAEAFKKDCVTVKENFN